MTVRYGGNDVFRPESRITAEKHLRNGRLERQGVDYRNLPSAKFDAQVAFDPGKSIFLADGYQHVVGFNKLVGLAGRNQAAFALFVVHQLLPFQIIRLLSARLPLQILLAACSF